MILLNFIPARNLFCSLYFKLLMYVDVDRFAGAVYVNVDRFAGAL